MHIIINSSLMVPIYEQIMEQIKTQIRDGSLHENDSLPSVRALSKVTIGYYTCLEISDKNKYLYKESIRLADSLFLLF